MTKEREQAEFRTRWGAGSVTVVNGALVEVTLPRLPLHLAALSAMEAPPASGDRSASAGGADGSGGPSSDGELDGSGGPATAAEWAQQMEAYFSRDRLGWTPEEVDLAALHLTPFREAVYRALLSVRPGAVVTYGELAAAAGRPRAARAVGSAMAENPLPLVVPCHRVVRGDGTLGRYGDDERWKPLLLALEGAPWQVRPSRTQPAASAPTSAAVASRRAESGRDTGRSRVGER